MITKSMTAIKKQNILSTPTIEKVERTNVERSHKRLKRKRVVAGQE